MGGPTVPEYAELIVKGGWPALQRLNATAAMDALTDYVDNLADVDLRTLDGRPDPIRMTALLSALARNTSTEAALQKLDTEAEIPSVNLSVPTVRKYLDQLNGFCVGRACRHGNPHPVKHPDSG